VRRVPTRSHVGPGADSPSGDSFVFPASSAQQRLWFLEQLEPGTHVYNLPQAFRLEGRLDVGALERALREIVRRHESLRTTFAEEKNGPVQVVHPAGELSFAYENLETGDAGRPRAADWISERARTPFDLARGPLFRANLVRLSDQEHVLLISMHHIVSDGWSLGILYRELETLYGSFTKGEGSPLSDLPVQHADHAIWQSERLSGEMLEGELAYWRRQLAGAPELLALPTDRRRPQVQTYQGAKVAVSLTSAISEGVRRLGQRETATPFMVLLAAFQVLLSRHSGQEDVVVGTTIANRDRVETESLIGFFVNTLALRTDLSGNPTFGELVRRIRSLALDAYAHSELPFERLVQELSPRRQRSHTPLFQVLFGLRSPMALPQLEGLSVSRVALDSETAKFDLTLILEDSGPEIAGFLQYNTDLFETATAERLVAQLEMLLESAVSDPDQRISDLPLMSAAERHRVLVEWNAAGAPYPPDFCLHELFQRQVERSPDAVAASCDEEEITYARLNERANGIAHHLRALGVGPEVIVAVLLERSIEMLAGILAVLKAGGAYLPLDPTHPTERLQYMIADAGARILLTTESLRDRVPSSGLPVVSIDGDAAALSERADDPASPVFPSNAAYVIYTSGSTGRPKGVVVEHDHVVRLFRATDGWYRFGAADVWTLFHSYAFDFSVWEMWGAWLFGGRLVVVPYWVSRSPESFIRLLAERKVTILSQTPSAFRPLIAQDAAGSPELPSLRAVVFGGEALEPADLRAWVARYSDRAPRLVNMYGITETTVHVTYRPITRADVDTGTGSVIGRPMPDMRVYVLDPTMEPAPIGMPGEIYVSGGGVARGYLGRPDLTAERFLPNPHAERPGERLYRSGDRARFLEGGELEYLGRLDHQVKVRGFRIEPAEIESVLAGHPGVRECAVLPREGVGDEALLVAYFVPAGRPPVSVAELRGFLRDRLPDYMVPSRLVPLDAFPRTATDKLDRRALPSPEAIPAGTAERVEAPRTPLEEVVAGIFAAVLEVEGVGAHGNFFDLGGHSLLAAQVVSRVRASLGVELPLSRLFDEPTVAGLAAEIESLRAGPRARALPPLTAASRDGDLPLSFAQERLWFLDQLHPGSANYNVFEAVVLEGTLDREALRRSLEELLRRHESLRTRFSGVDGAPVQIVSSPDRFELPIEDLRHLAGENQEREVRRLARDLALRPFDLAAAPLFRAALIALGNASHVLVWAVHHISSDGWSLAILRRELSALYATFASGETSSLPELPVQYADFAVWQRSWLAGEELESQLSYWRERLAGVERLRLPADRHAPGVRTGRGARAKSSLSFGLSNALRDLSRRHDVTPFMTVLAGFQTLLHRSTGQEDIAIGTDVANRRHLAIEGVVGFFANLLPLRTDLSGNPTFAQLLRRVREVTLGAYTHQDIPFAKLISGLRVERSLSENPLVQTLLVQNNAGPPIALPGLKARRLEIESGLAKFDLAVFVDDRPSGLELSWRYASDLFDPETMARLADQFEALLRGAVSDPVRPLRDLPLALSPASARSGSRRAATAARAGQGMQSARRKAIKL
jgi:amino acid adenylation domain-containing protein